MRNLVAVSVLLIFLWSCQTKNANQNSESEASTFSLTELWKTDNIMKTPESVLFDPQRNVLYVANMNKVDEGYEKGFISKLALDGTVIDLHWITGLHEPRGMGIYENRLFATDNTRLIVIDLEKEELVETIPVEGSVFLNDLAISKEGTVYFSDSRGSKVQTYKDGRIRDWFEEYYDPNGLSDQGEDMLICATSVGEVRRVNKETGEHEVLATGIGGDGIEFTGYEGYYIVSEWSGKIHIIGKDTVQTILNTEEQKINSADFGYDPIKKIVYVPTFYDNRVVAYELKMK
ncbi:SMP-30/gluconolactonase/LRE family protein [Bacteroidota bacterium]